MLAPPDVQRAGPARPAPYQIVQRVSNDHLISRIADLRKAFRHGDWTVLPEHNLLIASLTGCPWPLKERDIGSRRAR